MNQSITNKSTMYFKAIARTSPLPTSLRKNIRRSRSSLVWVYLLPCTTNWTIKLRITALI